jgi:hypothetical protein
MIRSSWNRDKEFINRWENFRANLVRTTPVPQISDAEKVKYKQHLEKHPEEWFEFMFPKYYSSEPAPFHIRETKRLLKNNRCYLVRVWSRELAKSTRGMMEDLLMALTGVAKVFILTSHSKDNADELLMPYLLNLESNPRLIWMYGVQAGFRSWEIGKFVTRSGASFRALGAGQSPRGSKNEEARPDVIRVDDIDTDERCRKEKRVSNLWSWVEQALIPTVSISGNVRIVFQGNLISKNSIIAKAMEMADHVSKVNIRDKNGKSTWPQKNTEELIDWILSKISYISQQKEYWNNPITEGSVFKEIRWDKVPAFSKFKFVVAYGDPSPSNQDTKKNSHKTVVLMAKYKLTYYVITAWLEQTTNANYITWYHNASSYVDGRAMIYNYMENNGFQDPFYKQVYKPLMISIGSKMGNVIHIKPDERKKPDKFTRMEAALEPINSEGNLIFNIAEKNNPHMKKLEEQFKAVEPELSVPADGPDAVEGGKWIIDRKFSTSTGTTTGKRGVGTYKNKKRY